MNHNKTKNNNNNKYLMFKVHKPNAQNKKEKETKGIGWRLCGS